MGTLYVDGITFLMNTANTGGGLWNTGYANLTNLQFSSNESVQKGGGIFSSGSSSETIITSCTLTNNSSANGGGFYLAEGTMTFVSSEISGNQATTMGAGGTYATFAILDISDPTNNIYDVIDEDNN
jgi:predicted outer membrane repeat protein